MTAMSPKDELKISAEELDERARDIFREIVETYLTTGEPVGSRTLSRRGASSLSPASIRNTMADLTEMGLLESPHISAGRQPTHLGLRLFVDGFLEFGGIPASERSAIDAQVARAGSPENLLEEASTLLSGLAGGAGLVLTPKPESALKHIEFVALSPQQTLAVLVHDNDLVENRLINHATPMPPSVMVQAANFLNARLRGKTLREARGLIDAETKRTILCSRF